MKFKALLSIVATILFIAIISESAIANSNVSESPLTNVRWSDEKTGIVLFDKPESLADATVSITVYRDGEEVDSYSFEGTDNYDVRAAINESGNYTFDVYAGSGTQTKASTPLEYKRPDTAMQNPINVRWILNDEDTPYPIWDWPDDTTQFYVEIITPENKAQGFNNYTRHSIPEFANDRSKFTRYQYRMMTLSDDISTVANSEWVESPVYYYGSGEPFYDPSLYPSPTPAPNSYDYDYFDYGEKFFPPVEQLEEIKTVDDAQRVVHDTLLSLSQNEILSMTTHLRLRRFAEEAAARAATIVMPSQFTIDYDLVSSMETLAIEAKDAVYEDATRIAESKRDLRTMIRIKVSDSTALNQPLNPIIRADSLLSLSPGRALSAALSPASINIKVDESYSNANVDTVIVDTGGAVLYLEKGNFKSGTISVSNHSATTASVQFDSSESIMTVAFPGQGKSGDQYTVFDSEGANTGGIYDPGSGTFMAKIEKSGVFNVALNEKDFSDIKKEHSQVQKAIKALASKGVINGRTPTEYEPSDKITRAEVATLFVLALKKFNANADGGFIDVKKSDWFFGAAGSSKNQSLIAGYEDNTFRGNTNIPKAQIISISGRVLANEMGYTPPPEDDIFAYKFEDDSDIPDWAKGDIYLAQFAGVVPYRVDGLFDSYEEMTRGNVAVLIWNLYQRIW